MTRTGYVTLATVAALVTLAVTGEPERAVTAAVAIPAAHGLVRVFFGLPAVSDV